MELSMALQLQKFSDTVWAFADGSTTLAILDSAANVVTFPGTVKFGAGSGASPTATQITKMAQGVVGGYLIARGEVTLDGSNPTTITTGLTTVVACVVVDKRATAPALDPIAFTVDYGGGVTAGTVDVYAWKATDSTHPTLIASTDADDVLSWIAVGV
jgi:hypothetical protein